MGHGRWTIFTIPCFFGRRPKKQRDGLGIDRYNFEFCNVQFSNVWNEKLTYYLICSFINMFSVRVRTIYVRTHLLLQFTTALYSWISRAGNIIFGCGKKPFGTVLGLYLDSEKMRNNVNSRILPFFNFYQPAKHNRRHLFAARCTTHFNFIIEIAILLQFFSDNCKTSAVFMINAAKYFFTQLFSNFQ